MDDPAPTSPATGDCRDHAGPTPGDGSAAGAAPRADRLGQARLILILAELLRRRSVGEAARHFGLHSSAISRALGELRRDLGDPLFVRTGQGLVPTPFAESIRPLVHGLADGIESLFSGVERSGTRAEIPAEWNVETALQVPDLATSRPRLEGEPLPSERMRLPAGETVQPWQRLSRHIATVATGSGRARPMRPDEAEDAMTVILDGEADPVQIGSLLTLIQHRGLTAPELAGFVRALRAHVGVEPGEESGADLDWPCYVSPNDRRAPWFFHAARLVASAGHRVLLHGGTGAGSASGRYELLAVALGIGVGTSRQDARAELASSGIAYLPVAAFAPQLHRLKGLHRLTFMRSPADAMPHLLDPLAARATLLGVAVPAYEDLHRDVGLLLGHRALTILCGSRDVAQFTPFRSTRIARLSSGNAHDLLVESRPRPRREARPPITTLEYWTGVWTGAVRDPEAEEIVVSTAAAGLLALAPEAAIPFEAALATARELWQGRRTRLPRGGRW